MESIPNTSTTLLRSLALETPGARWGDFVSRYRPMMEAFMKSRFPAVEADDVIQETLLALSRIIRSYRYSPQTSGHFHNYLTGILKNKALEMLRRKARQERIPAEMAERLTPKTSGDSQDWRQSMFEIALRQFLDDPAIADRTKQVFTRTAINGESPEKVAASLKMTRHAVDQAKSRSLSRIRELVAALEAVANG